MLIKRLLKVIITFNLLIIGQIQSFADKVPAFPSAEGGGMYTTGGRGGEVLYVTDLTDSGKEGSFRWAVTRNYPRTVVFKISGTIELEKKLLIRSNNLTIAGQTAPGDGITIKGYPVKLQANNIIIRYIRFRMGDLTKQQSDAFEGQMQKDIIIDHCSISWSTDENSSFYGNENFTMQWCIIAESLNHSVHEKGNHGYGGIWGGVNATFHHNLLANNNSRNPRFDHPGIYSENEQSIAQRRTVDFVNNVIFNWHDHASYGGESGKFNIINNYYKPGKDSKRRETFLNPYKEKYEYGKFYVEGNIIEGNKRISKNNKLGITMEDKGDFATSSELLRPIKINGKLKIDNAKKAYQKVIQNAGASFVRDAVDKRIIKEVQTGVSTYKGNTGGYDGIIDTQEDVGAWPQLSSHEAPLDTDNDGIPDEWELKNKMNWKDKADGNIVAKDGYTMLEKYLNGILK